MDVAVKPETVEDDMQAVIAARVAAILQAHANNLIEGLDMGAEALEAMLQRAREPVSNEAFTRREKKIWLEKYAQAAQRCTQQAVA